MSNFKELDPTFVDTFIRQIKMMQIVGVGIPVETDASYIKKYRRLIVFSSAVLFMYVGQILYFVDEIRDENSNVLDIINTLPTVLMVTTGKMA